MLQKNSLISDREREVLQLVGKGYSTKEIALQLYISTNTVETHRKKILKKMSAKNITEAYAKFQTTI